MAKFLIVQARFYEHLNDLLIEGAVAALEDEGHKYRSEEHTSELQSLMRISYAVFCLKKQQAHNANQLLRYVTHAKSHIREAHVRTQEYNNNSTYHSHTNK